MRIAEFFIPNSEFEKEVTMEGGLYYLFFAYTILWVINFGYIFFLGKRYKDVQRELEHLEKIVSGK